MIQPDTNVADSSVILSPCQTAHGDVLLPPSKSELHRALILAAFSGLLTSDSDTAVSREPVVIRWGPETENAAAAPLYAGITGPSHLCDDVLATVDCLTALGAVIRPGAGCLSVIPPAVSSLPRRPVLDCRESGTTLRLLLPAVCGLISREGVPDDIRITLVGRGSLPSRPIKPLLDALADCGCVIDAPPSGQSLPLTVRKGLPQSGCSLTLDASISSQFVSGALIALATLRGPSSLRIVGTPVSTPYISMTLAFLSRFTDRVGGRYPDFTVAQESETARPPRWVTVGGDWSCASVLTVIGLLSKHPEGVRLYGLSDDGLQGDSDICRILSAAGGVIRRETRDGARVLHAFPSTLRGFSADLSQTPDLLPALCAAGAGANGRTVLRNCSHARYKESDRLSNLCDTVDRLGGHAVQTADSLVIDGAGRLDGGTVDSDGDHRIAMCSAALSTLCDRSVVIRNAGCVSKSFPDFWSCLSALIQNGSET